MIGNIRIGIDVGGTFTDLFLFHESTGAIVRHKLPSTPERPFEAPIKGILELLRKTNAAANSVKFVGLGTTVATNDLLERKGARVALIATKGFRDLLEIGRQRRPHLYDLFVRKPEPLVPREYRLEVTERMGSDGEPIERLDVQTLEQCVEQLKCSSIESIAVCFLNSYVNPEHESQAKAILERLWPNGAVTISSDVLPEFREYERLSTTVVNAYLAPRIRTYFSQFSREVGNLGIVDEPLVMNSGGGVVSPALAGERPIDTLFSGPSGGVSGAAFLASLISQPNIVTFDMGGTSTDVCLIKDFEPAVTQSRVIDGLPIKSTALDVHTVGAGGSSVAWIDQGGLLHVGPRSAGARPGPACYDTGGTEPTITDANIVLGRLNPEYLLGGALKINAARSFQAIEQSIARPRNVSVVEAACAMLAVATANMAQAIRYVSVERGLNPGDFMLFAFGGAGPLHAAAVASELGMPVLVPESPGVLCAMGVLTKDVQIDVSRTYIVRDWDSAIGDRVTKIYDELSTRASRTFERAGLTGQLVVRLSVDARYVGQNFEIPISVSAGDIDAASLENIRERFHQEHERLYGYCRRDRNVEFVTFRMTASLPTPKPELKKTPPRHHAGGSPQSLHTRPVFFESCGGFLDCPIFDRSTLLPGDSIPGPAIIEQMDTTTLIPEGFSAKVDELFNFMITPLRSSLTMER